MFRALVDTTLFVVGVWGGLMLPRLIGYFKKCYQRRQQNWAKCIIEQYQEARKEQMTKMMEDASRLHAYATGPNAQQFSIGNDFAHGLRVSTEERSWDLPPFVIDRNQLPEENADRMREHLDCYAPGLPTDDKEGLVIGMLHNVFIPHYEERFKEGLEELTPEDFREED